MFSYTLPCGGFKTITSMTSDKITFDPPVYEQRYCCALQILEDERWKPDIKKIVEFGCAEMRLFPMLRRIATIEHILEVDIDDVVLKNHLTRTNPLISDYINERKRPLHVEVLQGSVADSAEELRNTDAVIALELIEHVYDDVLAKIPSNVFGFMKPKIVIFSTPNADYNVIFTRFNPLLENGFRHFDHKFEWTREEFKSWCLSITEKYSNYVVSLMGVGDPPTDFESVGHVSQIALFVRKDMLGMPLGEPLLPKTVDDISPDAIPYKSLHAVDFPYYVDTRSKEDIIWAEIEYELHLCMRNPDNFDADKMVYKMLFTELLSRIEHLGATTVLLHNLLREKNIKVENDWILTEEPSNSSDEEMDLTMEGNYDDYIEEDWDAQC